MFQRASDTVTVGGLLRVNTAGSEPWNRFTPDGSKHREIWTRHGLPLDTLTFFVAVKDGEPLDDLAEKSDKAPHFRARMSAEDVVALTETMLVGRGGHFELAKLEPAPFAGHDGFRFTFDYVTRAEEVPRRGLGSGAIIDRRLYLILFLAPSGLYFDEGARNARILIEGTHVAATPR
ncbi:MAG: hypothetical protein RBS46_03425 [Methyloversatilis sp.]|nr:hypothetical protein [Methyloversatilis sp.]